MTSNIDRIQNQVVGVIEALETMSQKERQGPPKKVFLERYSQHRMLAMETMPHIDEPNWPPRVTDPRRANYVEILSYYKDISALLSEGSSPPPAGFLG